MNASNHWQCATNPSAYESFTNMSQARDIINDALVTAMHAMSITVATTLGGAPGSIAFAWDAFLNMPVIVDWQDIARLWEHYVN